MMILIWLLAIVTTLILIVMIYRLLRGSVATQDSPLGLSDRPDPFGLSLDQTTGTVLDAIDDHTATHGHYLATACELAYLPSLEATEQFRKRLNLSAQLVSFDNTQAYVCQNAQSIVVAFRGSETPTSIDGFKDWLLTNARNFLVLPEGRIGTDFAAAGVGARFHRGFMSALDEIWQPLYASVDAAFKQRQRPIWITGHSLGGAIALLAAWRFHQKFLPVHRICTFGAPMIGNVHAADAYLREFPGRIIRYVDFSDMVPKLPATSLLQNAYDHVQREIVLGGDGQGVNHLLAASDMPEIPESDDGVHEVVANGIWRELHSGISAHLMGNYLARIAEDLR